MSARWALPASHLRWWRRRSLRARLTAAALVVIAVAIGLSAVLLSLRLSVGLVAAVDEAALDRAQAVAAAVLADELTVAIPVDDDDELVQVLDQAGDVVASSPGLPRERAVLPWTPAPGVQVRTVDQIPVPDPNNPYRVLTMPVRSDGERLVVVVALSLEEARESVGELRRALAFGAPVVVALLAGVTWLLVGQALRPVESLRRQAAELPGTAPQQRLQVPPSGDELARLAQTFNDLLTRVESATRRQREFVADAAHEIRSPLAALRAQLEVAQLEAQRHPGEARWREDLPSLVDDAARLSRLVDDLLRLARLDARRTLVREPVDLDDIVLDAVRRTRTQAPVPVDASRVGAARVSGDADALARVVANLLDNAGRHARRGIVVTLSCSEEGAVLTVTDDGPGVPAEARERVFDRFTRLDESRTRDSGGAGLGLAIVRDVVEQHGGWVRLQDASPGARFVVHLPAAGPGH